ncbi:DUF423 domain containing protein [Euroglyphus maynei]|uniref:DUF423 domain containing protein n=1 Tax=Euroglyphus maynei TaxID=6958 RepID=A0A1Y3AVX1_EURMA|nr:DUF423 domain containing protein [Euroglyphus maynei]
MSFIQSYIPKDLLYNCFSYLNYSSQKMATQPSTPKLDFQLIAQHYSSSPWVKIAAICGASAVVLGAYGAHGLSYIFLKL